MSILQPSNLLTPNCTSRSLSRRSPNLFSKALIAPLDYSLAEALIYSAKPIFIQQSKKNIPSLLQIVKKALASNGFRKNMLASPLSIATMLNIMAFGSGGRHQQYMLQLLGSKTLDVLRSDYSVIAAASAPFSNTGQREAPVLNFVNGAWVNQDLVIKPHFQQVLTSTFNAQISSFNLRDKVGSANKINLWAKRVSNGLINEIIDSYQFDEETMIILANALYFRGKWEDKFDRAKDRYFYTGDGSEKFLAPFMRGKYGYEYKAFKKFQVAKVAYKSGDDGRKLSMNIFLPNENDGLPALLEDFSANPSLFLSKTLSVLSYQSFSKFLVPKFKFTYGFDVTEIMKSLGLNTSRFTEMVEDGNGNSVPFTQAKVFQKARIIVDEEGTKAVAMTYSLCMGACARPSRPPPILPSFIADHPFMFVITEDNTGIPLFIGVMVNPLLD